MADHLDTAVALILFNRPDYTKEVFAAIRAARPARLHLIADGPRPDHPEDPAGCAAAREVVAVIDWPCIVRRDYAEQNLGSGRRVASGLDGVFAVENEAIVLEDDFAPLPDFFRFCAEMLARYRDDARIMTVTGANFLAHVQEFPATDSYFFSRYYAIAGWATWRRAWRTFDFSVRRWPAMKATGQLSQLYPDPYVRHYYHHAWDQCLRGERPDVWDFQWMFACAAANGLCVVPRVNLVSHIGIVGTHSDRQSPNDLLPRAPLYNGAQPLHHPSVFLPNPDYDLPFFRRNFHPASVHTFRGRLKRALRAASAALRPSGGGLS